MEFILFAWGIVILFVLIMVIGYLGTQNEELTGKYNNLSNELANYKKLVSSLTDEKMELQDKVSELTCWKETHTKYGLEKAYELLSFLADNKPVTVAIEGHGIHQPTFTNLRKT